MRQQASIDSFAEITLRVIARDGFEGYMPTALYPARREVLVLEDAPEDETLERIATQWASDQARDDEDFLLAFKIDGQHFKILHRSAAGVESRVVTVTR